MKQTTLLNPQQQQAVEHVEGPMLVLAGAGSGKTRIVIHRILHLLDLGVPASEILAVTFTNKAAEEMKSRIVQLAQVQILTCTFHSLAARILRESISQLGYAPNFIIVDEEDSEKTLKDCLISLGLKEDKSQIKNFRAQISHAKNQLLEPEAFSQENPSFFEIYSLYQNRLKEYGALDFDDLLFLTVKLFKQEKDILTMYQNRWNFILIDEYQDTNAAQYQVTKFLSGKHQNVFAVGDPDQSIYSWRGANVQNILHFEQDYPGAKVVTLEQNYRSSNNILKAANALIKKNSSRYEKSLWSDKGEGEKIQFFHADNELKEADFVVLKLIHFKEKQGASFKECAIFYRTNFQSRTFEDALLKNDIPYIIVGGMSFYQRKEIKDVLALLRMVMSGNDFLAFSRTINTPRRGFGEVALGKLKSLCQDHKLDIFSIALQVVEKKMDAKLSSRQLEGLKEYLRCILSLREMIKQERPLDEILTAAIERSRYLDYLKEDPETLNERRDNIQELISKASEWQQEAHHPDIASFLEELTLKSSTSSDQEKQDCVKLMTLHNGKGLEFKIVFLVGMEEDLLPHINVKESEESIEEERRLCYVGITRAKEYLFLTAARTRFLWGSSRMMRQSRFLKEIPSHFVNVIQKSSYKESYAPEPSYEEDSFQPGDTVFHKDFGAGIVHKVYQTSLGLTYDVFFPKASTTRTLVAKYAKLAAIG
ncbi:MAG: ATP-dependent DNA helicase [Chlamydiae bacterium]|nr:ATP-dependent DNA helicase [Chlamydiota bacterium]